DLDDASDTGRANDDNITSDRTPTFTITNYRAVTDADNVSVKWFIDGVEQKGETGAIFTTSELSDRTYVVTAQFIDEAGNIASSNAIKILIVSDCGCESETFSTIPNQELQEPIEDQKIGLLFYKASENRDRFYNEEEYDNRFWIYHEIETKKGVKQENYYIICNESVFNREYDYLKNTNDSIKVKFTGNLKRLCILKPILAIYNLGYTEIVLTSIEQQ
ncbi:MAG: hypothetical protein GDA37_11890, partial [Ekhidna sp.]|nr:hypothetical protein [Ekhidna sp.]